MPIVVDHITKSFPERDNKKKHKLVLENVSFSVPESVSQTALSSSHRSLPAPVVCSMTTVENGFSTTRSTVHGMAFSVPSVVK